MSLDMAEADPWSLAGDPEAAAYAALRAEEARQREEDVPAAPPPARPAPNAWQPPEGPHRRIWEAIPEHPHRWVEWDTLLARVCQGPGALPVGVAGAALLALAGERHIRVWRHPSLVDRSVVARGGFRACDCGLNHVPPGPCGCGRLQ